MIILVGGVWSQTNMPHREAIFGGMLATLVARIVTQMPLNPGACRTLAAV